MTTENRKERYLEAGTYIIRGTYRQTLRVEEGLRMKEIDAVDEALADGCAELVDWEIVKIR